MERTIEPLRRFLVPLFCAALAILFLAPLFDPAVQLYYRDAGRLYYPVKLFIASELRSGRLPLWDPLTECGVSILGQMTPGLFHPATLLYLPLPFDVAFKLNHALGLLLGGIGAYRLARRLGASEWPAACAAVAYGGCGYLVSMAGSNLPYALGAGTVPLAVDAALGFVERPSAGRLGWAGAALASVALAGEPQSLLIAGLIAGGWTLAAAVGDRVRKLGLLALAGAAALCLSAPAVLPAVAELRRSDRAGGVSLKERESFVNHPLRLAGLLLPRAFDDSPEAAPDPRSGWSTFSEYFAPDLAAFADSIVVGAPALLLALAAFFASRKGRLLVLGAALFALSSAGDALGIEGVLFRFVPLAQFFRFAEKLIAPASLLVALAAAVGAEAAFAGTRRAARTLALGAAGLAVAALLVRGAIGDGASFAPYGKTHAPGLAAEFALQLKAGLLDVAILSAALAVAAAWRAARDRPAAFLAAVCCAGSVFASCGGLLYTAPVEFVRGPFDLAQRLTARAGPSRGRWRIFVDDKPLPRVPGASGRIAPTWAAGDGLYPQFNATAGIEGMAPYFSVGDPAYAAAITEAPEKLFDLFGVRFAVESPGVFTEAGASRKGFRRAGDLGFWLKEYPVASRAFVVGTAIRVVSIEDGARSVARMNLRSAAIVRGAGAPDRIDGVTGPARLTRPSPGRIHVEAKGPGLLVVAEHFDPGWGPGAIETDLAAIGVPLPPGPASIDLRFIPRGLLLGTGLFAAAIAGILALGWGKKR